MIGGTYRAAIRRLRPLLAGGLLLVAALSSATASAASARRVAVLRLDFNGRVTEVARDDLASRLVEALAAADFQVFAGPVMNQIVQKGSALESCRAETCYREISAALGVQYLVTGSVAVERRNYEIALELVEGQSGRTLGASREVCELCGLREVGDKMTALARKLNAYVPAGQYPGRIAIESSPAGAAVSVDGQPRGATPVELELPAGDRDIAVSLAGYRQSRRRVKVEEDARSQLVVDLAPAEGGFGFDGSAPAGRRVPRWAGWTAIAVGVAATAAGAVLLAAVDGTRISLGNCPADERDFTMNPPRCNLVRETRLEAGILMGAGAASVAFGSVVLYLSPARATAASAGNGVVVGAQGRF
jgi:TolB-like protein